MIRPPQVSHIGSRPDQHDANSIASTHERIPRARHPGRLRRQAGRIVTTLLAAGFTTLSLSAPASEPTSENNERLARALRRYPAADADDDGVLTAAEAKDHMAKVKVGKAARTNTPTPGGTAAREAGKGSRTEAEPASAGAKVPTFADVAYGPHANQKLDFWQAKADRPAPLVVFIHGGGFVGGDKSKARSLSALPLSLEHGVHFASINYRFRTELPIQEVLRDSARAIQFLRSKAGEWNIDKSRIAAYGGSAGAGTSLWLAFHDDLADPDGGDPVARESTRLAAAGSISGQFSYDVLQWEEVLGPEAMRFGPQKPEFAGFYGLKAYDDLLSDEGRRIRADVDLRGHISKDDPPVYLSSAHPGGLFESRNDVNHHPLHMEVIKKRCDEVGAPAVLDLPKAAEGARMIRPDDAAIRFLLDKLGVKLVEK